MALVTLRTYINPIDAELARTQLDLAGIEAAVQDQHLVSIQWLYSNAIGGVKVKVDEEDLSAAREILDQENSAALADLPESEFSLADGDLCPVCESSAVHHSRVQRNAAAVSLATGLPFLAWRRHWVCENCGHSWKSTPPAPLENSRETTDAERSVQTRDRYPIVYAALAALTGLGILCYLQFKLRSP